MSTSGQLPWLQDFPSFHGTCLLAALRSRIVLDFGFEGCGKLQPSLRWGTGGDEGWQQEDCPGHDQPVQRRLEVPPGPSQVILFLCLPCTQEWLNLKAWWKCKDICHQCHLTMHNYIEVPNPLHAAPRRDLLNFLQAATKPGEKSVLEWILRLAQSFRCCGKH